MNFGGGAREAGLAGRAGDARDARGHPCDRKEVRHGCLRRLCPEIGPKFTLLLLLLRRRRSSRHPSHDEPEASKPKHGDQARQARQIAVNFVQNPGSYATITEAAQAVGYPQTMRQRNHRNRLKKARQRNRPQFRRWQTCSLQCQRLLLAKMMQLVRAVRMSCRRLSSFWGWSRV